MHGPFSPKKAAAFTLVEMLVSMAVLVLLVAILSELMSGLRQAIAGTTSQIGEFQSSRDAFETMTRRISQATLNSYDDQVPTSPTFTLTPQQLAQEGLQNATLTAGYLPASELRFVSGPAVNVINGGAPGTSQTSGTGGQSDAIFFQAPLGYTSASGFTGLLNLLNTVGYFTQWGSDQYLRPGFLNQLNVPYRYRMRLMEMIEPSDHLTIYNDTSGPKTPGNPQYSNSWYYNGQDWFKTPMGNSNYVHVIAENVILLVLLPMVAPQNAQNPVGGDTDGTSLDIAPNYYFNSSPYESGTSAATSNTQYPMLPNLLPPMVYVLMIAVDEQSFSRFEKIRSDGQPDQDPSSLLGMGNGTGTFLQKADYKSRWGTSTTGSVGDIVAVETALTAAKINYRVYSAAVQLSSR